MSAKEEGLRRRIGSDYIIGSYQRRDDGTAYFSDIRGMEGDLVKLPDLGNTALEVSCSDQNLEVGQFYQFQWKLMEPENKIVIVGDIEQVNNEKFLQGLFDARFRLKGSNLELFNNFQKTIFNEVTGAQHTYIYELLQNANDYPYQQENVEVKFVLTDHYLFFLHSGDYFNLRNIVGISSINQGEKAKNTETIGYKGIGFKTVFVNNEYVYLKSGPWSLRFDRAYSEERFYGECPWALMPIPTPNDELDEEIKSVLSTVSEKMRVQFALRHKSNARNNLEQLDKVFGDNQILLFIPHVFKVTVIADGKDRHIVEKDKDKWVVKDFSYSVPQELKDWVEVSINSGEKVPEKFKDINLVRISFAVGRNENILVPIENARVYNYLPTELRLGFNFLFNADFIPNGSRSGLHDVKWNDCIMEQCGQMFADWWTSFMCSGTNYDLESVFSLLPELTSREHYGTLFLKGFSQRIVDIPCVPVLLGDEYKLVKLSEAIHDKCGVIVSDNPVFTDEEFYNFSGKKGYLPHPSVRQNANLIRLLTHYSTSVSFNGNDLTNLSLNGSFQRWLASKENNVKFISFLLKSGFLINFWNYAIFLKADGTLGKAETIYYDIDKYIADISFLASNLPRLDVDVRNALTVISPEWAGYASKFKLFREDAFTRGIFANFTTLRHKFETRDNSVHFLHFLAITNFVDGIPSQYPLYDECGRTLIGKNDIYQKNEIGENLVSHTWIDKQWISFLHDEYTARDKDIVENYLSVRCSIKPLTARDCYTIFIANDKRVGSIAKNILSVEQSKDFYRYLASIQEDIGNFTPSMRSSYTLLTTDGKTDSWTPVTKTIFWKDEDWAQAAQKEWMPEGCCVGLSDTYFEGLTDDETKSLKTLFNTKQLVQQFRTQTLFSICLRPRLDDVFAMITNKEISYDFLNFLFESRSMIFKDNTVKELFKGVPILSRGANSLEPISNGKSIVFASGKDVDELYEQPWFDKSSIRICDEFYSALFDGKERQEFFRGFGILPFDKVEYARDYQLKHLDRIREMIHDRDSNLAFYHYFAAIHDDLSENDLSGIKELPIFISSPDNENGIEVDGSYNHYLPSQLLTEIIAKDLVPISILDAIHPDYISSEKDIKFFVDKLGNFELDLEEFVEYIVKEEERVAVYLQDKERNIRFWQWACKLNVNADIKNELKCFPLLCRQPNSSTDVWGHSNELFISNAYNGGIDIEDFVNEYVGNPKFVSPCYAEMLSDEEEYNWKSLFKTIRITTDVKEIVFKKVLPQLSEIKKTSIVGILSQYVDAFSNRLHNQDKELIEQIGRLQLLCDDGVFRSVMNVLVSGRYFDIEYIPFPDIVIGKMLSEQYITDCHDNDEVRRNVVKLITLLADVFNVKCETATQLRNYKLKYFLSHQRDYNNDEAHYRIIGQLNDAYNKDTEGIEMLMTGTPTLLLYNSKGLLMASTSLYLSSAYHPACDYMGNGVNELDFVSERYIEFSQGSYNRFFRKQNIRDTFATYNLPQLSNERFAVYFWTEYAANYEWQLKDILTEQNLRTIPCVPSPLGIRKPCELYDYRNPQLQKMVLKLQDGSNRLPSVSLPEWMKNTHIGFRGRLYFVDCLEYLSLNIGDFRRDVMDWITDTDDETIRRYSRKLEEFTENALWFNGEKQWVPLKDLKALEWDNKTLKDNFSGNAYICNPSYMPEYKLDYNRLCGILNIQILTNEDFQKRKEGKCFEDKEAVAEIRKRLLYLAYKAEEDDWKALYDEYNEKLSAADISDTERIVYYYNDNIETDLQVYAEDEQALWYVGGWKGPMFLAVLDWIIKKIGIKGRFDINFLQRLFLGSFADFIKRQEGGALPQEVLDCLDEMDKNGLRVDNSVGVERFVESNNDINELPSTAPTSNVPEKHEGTEPSRTTSQTNTQAPVGQSNSSRNNRETSSTKSTIPAPSKKEDSAVHETPKKSTEEKLREEFEMKAQRNVGRPTSSSNSNNFTSDLAIKNGQDPTPPDPRLGMDAPRSSSTNRDSNYSSMSKTSQTINRKNTEAQNNAEHAAEQVDILELWNSTQRYSYLWYKYLMKLQNGDRAKSSRRTIQIDFGGYELTCENKILHLSSPSLIVPSWLEDASISIMAIGNGSKKIDGGIVKVDEMEVDIIIKPEDISKLNGATKIRVSAESLTNIIDSLEIRFLQLGYDDSYDMQANLPEDVSFIYGPPGTGKTTRLAERLHEIVTGADAKLNILVLAPTNKAADVIAEKLACDKECYNYLTRFGSTESVKLLEEYAVLGTRDTIDMELLSHNIVVTTAARFAYDYFQTDDIAICDFNWDYIVVDEASMIDLITITYVLHKSKDSKFIIAGDPKQIQPISEIAESNVYELVGLDSFKDAITNYKRYPVEALKVQHRSVPSIGNLVSQFSYDGLVENDMQRKPQKPLSLDGISVRDVNFVGFRTDDFGDYLYSLSAIDNSAFHLYAAIFTYNMTDYVVKQITEKYPNGEYKIGIVCPYKAEANAVQQLLERKPLDTDVCKVTSGTVHRFQGDECDIMFIILNPPSNVTSGTHINNINILNVAMSRARDYIFFIVPDKHIDGFDKREELWRLVEEKDKTTQNCSKLEEIIFGSSNFIYDNTNVTPHLPVNVYYDTHALYEVRVDESTLDIQINDTEI